MVLYDGANKITLSDVIEEGGKLYITASAEETKSWIPSRYDFQVLDADGLAEKGQLKVQANLLYSSEVDSYWRKALKAVEDRLAGKALDPANDISVGDKRISYYHLDELLQLRDFILKKIAEEDEEEGEEDVLPNPNDQKVIQYVWRR
jgi:hypothetical protein